MALFGGLFGSSNQETGSGTTTQLPYEPQRPYIDRSFQYAQGAYDTAGGFTPQLQNAYSLIQQRALQGSPLNRLAGQNLTSVLNRDFLNQDNPYLQRVLDRTARETRDNVNSQYAAAGRYGSGAHDQAVARATGDVIANARLSDYQNQLQRLDAARAEAPGLAGEDFNDLDAYLQASQGAQDEAFRRAGQFGNLIGGNYGGTTTDVRRQRQPGVGQQILGGALNIGGQLFGRGLFG